MNCRPTPELLAVFVTFDNKYIYNFFSTPYLKYMQQTVTGGDCSQ